MAITQEQFVSTRPFVYHLTASINISSIRSAGQLDSARTLMTAANRLDLLRRRRGQHLDLNVGGRVVRLRDQSPLHERNIAFEAGWSFGDLLEALNGRVFFWPGTNAGPIEYGRRHFERYRHEGPVLIRVPTAELLHANPRSEPFFCKYNSGSPRYSGGYASPRGPNSFVPESGFGGPPSHVVEVTFLGSLTLPSSTETGKTPGGPWRPLSEN